MTEKKTQCVVPAAGKMPHHAERLLAALRCVVVLMPVAAMLLPLRAQNQEQPLPVSAIHADNPLVASVIRAAYPKEASTPLLILSADDIALYQDIIHDQRKADWAAADTTINALHNRLLLGHILAARYLDHRYRPTNEQLAEWLNHYRDHPQTADIYALAITQTPGLKNSLPTITKPISLEGYGDDNGLVSMHEEEAPYSRDWHAALHAWKNGHKEVAAKLFSNMDKYNLSPWMQSAADYWAYRSLDAIGENDKAHTYLQLAAQYPRSFYGVLACKKLGLPLNLDNASITLSDNDVLAMAQDPAIRRVVALTETGMTEGAEKELRLRFPQAGENEKPRLLELAHTLGLASVQISMAKQLHTPEHELDFARYPLPSWRPEGGFTVDPLLIYALVRQESGFRSSAVSPDGALGLMQLMPKTAAFMQNKAGMQSKNGAHTTESVFEPIANVTLGQDYVEHLLSQEEVAGNLLYLLAAYNAGPGRLEEWNDRFTTRDPLLFIESIPFGQTRNYVMQVMTNYWIYTEMEGRNPASAYALLKGQWPTYQPYTGAVAAKTDPRPNHGV